MALYKPGEGDSVLVPGSNQKVAVCPVYVFNPDGKPASFSPIRITSLNGTRLPLSGQSNRGISADNTGNIYLTQNDRIFKFGYETGECLN